MNTVDDSCGDVASLKLSVPLYESRQSDNLSSNWPEGDVRASSE